MTKAEQHATVIDILEAAGLRPTAFRCQVFIEIRSRQVPVTPSALFRTMPDGLSVGSVYRILAQLFEYGLLDRHHLSNGKLAYTCRQERQDVRVICPDCGKSTSLGTTMLDEVLRRTLGELGYLDARASVSAPCKECVRPKPKHSPVLRRNRYNGFQIDRYED